MAFSWAFVDHVDQWTAALANALGAQVDTNTTGIAANTTALGGLTIGTGTQAHDADLDAIAALSPANDDVLQRKSGAWTNRTLAQYKTDLALRGTANVTNTTSWTIGITAERMYGENTGLTGAVTINNPTGTSAAGYTLWIALIGTAARAITHGTEFEASTIPLPTTTVSTNRLDVGYVRTAASKWRVVAVA